MIRIGAPLMTTNRHSIEFQEQALSKVRQRGTRSVQDVANDLNMPVGTLRKWISKANQKYGDGGPAAQLPDDLSAQS
jgi:transposase-like protein